LGCVSTSPSSRKPARTSALSDRFRWYYNYRKLLRRFFDISPAEKEND